MNSSILSGLNHKLIQRNPDTFDWSKCRWKLENTKSIEIILFPLEISAFERKNEEKQKAIEKRTGNYVGRNF
jgi:hypothetical protein